MPRQTEFRSPTSVQAGPSDIVTRVEDNVIGKVDCNLLLSGKCELNRACLETLPDAVNLPSIDFQLSSQELQLHCIARLNLGTSPQKRFSSSVFQSHESW